MEPQDLSVLDVKNGMQSLDKCNDIRIVEGRNTGATIDRQARLADAV